MDIKYTKSFDTTKKKLKRYPLCLDFLNKITELIEMSTSFEELKKNPISKMYGFERLKHELNDFYSFNLEKSGGTKRLLIMYLSENNEIVYAYISYKHYEDFSKEKVIYYDE